ncbi:MAG: ABC transporter ATP-binding protein [Actinomycetota bacterium]|jgi:putative ABC transport system ATP-binding protein|nr:ABC transporter ATP-binding protein [Actinomycetota bacterium]
MTPVIEVSDLHKIYSSGLAETHALRGIDLTVERGEFVAVMGPSGSGKSTLMHILGCLDTSTSGTFLLDGQEVSNMDTDELASLRRTTIGFVFQAFNLLSRASVLRNVTLPMLYARVAPEEREERARKALLEVELEEELHAHLSNELSGGQMQRVAIARALVNDPSLILADEPTGNLDTKTGDAVMELFHRLHREGRTILLITHEPEVAAHAQRIIHIQDGVIDREECTGDAA